MMIVQSGTTQKTSSDSDIIMNYYGKYGKLLGFKSLHDSTTLDQRTATEH
jgi:hypothetical protein